VVVAALTINTRPDHVRYQVLSRYARGAIVEFLSPAARLLHNTTFRSSG
jgi:hypothetical protein